MTRPHTPATTAFLCASGSGPKAAAVNVIPRAILIVMLTILTSCSPVDDPGLHPVFDADKAALPPPKPMVAENPNRNVFWGDLHIHTSFSTDAYVMGVRTLPDDAYTFAKGGEIQHAAGYGIRIDRPLDFAAVTDHSEFLAAMRRIEPDVPLSARSLRTRLLNDSALRNTVAFLRTFIGFKPGDLDVPGAEVIARNGWQQIIDAAERHNDPGRFTSLLAMNGVRHRIIAICIAMLSTAVHRYPMFPIVLSIPKTHGTYGQYWSGNASRVCLTLPFHTTVISVTVACMIASLSTVALLTQIMLTGACVMNR